MQQILLKHLVSNTEGNCEEIAIAIERQKAPGEWYISTGKEPIAGEEQPIQITKGTEVQYKIIQPA